MYIAFALRCGRESMNICFVLRVIELEQQRHPNTFAAIPCELINFIQCKRRKESSKERIDDMRVIVPTTLNIVANKYSRAVKIRAKHFPLK